MSQAPQSTTTPAIPPLPKRHSIWLYIRLCLLGVLLCLSSVLALFGSQPGLQLLWYLQPRLLPALQIGGVTGDLWQGIALQQLRYHQAEFSLSADNIQIRFDLACAWQHQLCIPQLQVQDLQVELFDAAATKDSGTATPLVVTASTNDAASAQSNWPLPFSVMLDNLHVDQFSLKTREQQIRLTSLQTALQLQTQHLTLSGLVLNEVHVTLLQSNTTAKQDNPLPALLDWQLPLEVDLPALQLTRLTVQQHNRTLLQLDSFRSNISLKQAEWRLDNAALHLSTPTLQASGEVAINRPVRQLSVHLGLNLLASETAGPVALQLTGDGDMQAWPVSVDSTTPWPARLKAKVNLLSPAFLFEATLQAERLQWPLQTDPADAEALVLQQLAIAVAGDLQHQQLQLSVAGSYPDVPAADVSLTAAQKNGSIDIQALTLKTLNGEATLQGTWQLATQKLSAQLHLQGLQPGLFWADYPGDISGSVALEGRFNSTNNEAWQLQINIMNLAGELRDQPLTLNGTLTLSQPLQGLPQLQSPGLLLKHGPNEFKLQGSLAEQISLDARLHIADLSYSLALAEGSADAELKLRGDASKPDAEVSLQVRDLNYLDDYALAELTASAILPALGEKPSQISLNAKNGQAPGWQLQQIDWRSEGTQQQHQSHLILDSHQLNAVLAMEAGLHNQQWQATVTELRLQSDMGDWQLREPWPVSLQLASRQAGLEPACFIQADAAICLKQSSKLSPQQGELALDLQQFPLNSLDSLLPGKFSMEGTAGGTLGLRWLQGRLEELSWQLQSPQGLVRHQITTTLDLPWQALTFRGGLKDHTLSTSLKANLVKDSALTATVDIHQLGSTSPTLKAAIQLTPMSLAFIQPVFNEYSKFDGLFSANIRAEGALLNPAIYGNIAVDALQLTGKQAPLELTKASLLASFHGFAANLSSQWQTPEGKLDLAGDANWLTPDAWFSKLTVQGDNLQIQLMEADLTVSPHLTLTASPHSGQISGSIDVPAGNIRFNSLPEDAVRVSDDERLVSKQSQAGGKSDWALSSDIRLKIGEQVRLAAFGLKTRLQGDLRIRQQGLVPTLHGQVQLKDGSFRAYGQDLKLRKGRLTFNGPANQPLLAIEAIRNPEKTEDNVIAGLRVNGLADSPLIEVFSEPSKPQANALAYLLMGRDIGSSAGDGAVTAGLIGIGIANSGKLVGSIGEAFGISDLSLDTAGSGDKSKVTVSGYLSPRLQVKYGVGIFSQFGEFTLRYRLMQQVYVEAVQGLATSIDLLYKMEFD